MRASRYLVPLGLLLIGLCAAWPFRLSQPQRALPVYSAPLTAPLELPLRRADTPLELAPRVERSPAAELTPVSRTTQAPETTRSLAPVPTYDFANIAPPPALPVSFQPTGEPAPTSQWRPEPIAAAARPLAKPRPYRLRDGDTLETIAQRFLGSAERAADIYDANRDVLGRPDLLPVGVTILIPPREQAAELEPVSPR